MSPPFSNVNLLRIIQESESLFDKPGSEEFLSQLRENWEVLLMLMLYTGDSGTATENPSETVLTDGNAAYDADEHDGRSLVIIDGLAASNIYEIDATAATTLTCTGDTLLADGVRSGDAYKIFYNLKNTSAHTHNGVDSDRSSLALAKTGTYTGNGSTGQAITGIGFAPKYVAIWIHPVSATAQKYEKVDQSWGDYAINVFGHAAALNLINTLDADGFTVDDAGTDAHPNKNNQVYDYLVIG